MNRQFLVYTGFLPPLVFWLTNIVCSTLIPGYNHATRLVSELGTYGTPTQYLFSTGLVLCSVFSVSFIVVLYRCAKTMKLGVVPILLLFTYSFSILGAALFPYPLRLHEILGMPAIALFLSPLSAFVCWQHKGVAKIRLFAPIALVTMLLGFLVYAPNVMQNLFGIKQRFFHLGWTIWFIYLSITFGSFTDCKTVQPNTNQ